MRGRVWCTCQVCDHRSLAHMSRAVVSPALCRQPRGKPLCALDRAAAAQSLQQIVWISACKISYFFENFIASLDEASFKSPLVQNRADFHSCLTKPEQHVQIIQFYQLGRWCFFLTNPWWVEGKERLRDWTICNKDSTPGKHQRRSAMKRVGPDFADFQSCPPCSVAWSFVGTAGTFGCDKSIVPNISACLWFEPIETQTASFGSVKIKGPRHSKPLERGPIPETPGFQANGATTLRISWLSLGWRLGDGTTPYPTGRFGQGAQGWTVDYPFGVPGTVGLDVWYPHTSPQSEGVWAEKECKLNQRVLYRSRWIWFNVPRQIDRRIQPVGWTVTSKNWGLKQAQQPNNH